MPDRRTWIPVVAALALIATLWPANTVQHLDRLDTVPYSTDAAILALVRRAEDRATAILSANRTILDRCAQELLAHETLDAAELARLTQDLRPAAAESRTALAVA